MTQAPDVLGALYSKEIAKRGFTADAAQLAAIKQLERLRAELAEAAAAPLGKRLLRGLTSHDTAPKGVYLWGGVGRGKTWLMDLFFASLSLAGKRRTHFYRFMQEVQADLKRLKGMQSPLDGVADKIAKKSRVICFDELFVSDIADAMILANLFAALLKRGVALVFTSNVKPKDLYKNGLQRERFLPTITLLEKNCDVIAVDGGVDYRLRQLTAAPIYLASGAAGTPKKLGELFDDLSDEDVETDGTITVNGRKIRVVRESENVIWFEFAALCEGPRSPADYVAIASEYQSVLIANVPVFGVDADNAARRFISVIDEFYDRGVNVIVSAAAAPAELYQGEKLKFEFQRTASRLTEMQSQEYLARAHRAA
ncbi:MAG TPA: cell division protein ZapE [Steroidobacteraceae bacterium]|nr:cell division protein ZapE [Steroidobacteraceae bacterium]